MQRRSACAIANMLDCLQSFLWNRAAELAEALVWWVRLIPKTLRLLWLWVEFVARLPQLVPAVLAGVILPRTFTDRRRGLLCERRASSVSMQTL